MKAFARYSAGALVAISAAAAPASWEEAQPFSLSPAELRAAAAAVPRHPEYPCSVLLQAQSVVLDEAGRRTDRFHHIYRVEQVSSLGPWANVDAPWNTWLEQRPQVRARVVTPDGVEHALDPATLVEFQPPQRDPEVFTDQKVLRAPLPLLVSGAVVEVEILRQETRPFSAAGVRSSFMCISPVPVQNYRFSLDAPATRRFTWKVESLPEEVLQHREQGGRVLHTLRAGPSLPPPPQEPNEDPEQQKWPLVKYCSTPGWRQVAAEYAGILEGLPKSEGLAEVARQARGNAKGRDAVIEAVLAYVQKRVRYVALEFGEASIVPRTPAEVLRRGYGDCKDKSCLVVGLLGALGIEARVALLRVGTPFDLDPEMPGLSMFDHAIVQVGGPNPVWIDPAARYGRPGVLPGGDQGRWALVISRDTQGLVKTPIQKAEQNLMRRTMDVHLVPDGPTRIVETVEAGGATEIALRDNFTGADPQKLREFFTHYAAQRYRAKAIGALRVKDPEDLSGPFGLSLEAQEVGIAAASSREAFVVMNPWPVVNDFFELMQPPREHSQGDSDAARMPGFPKGGEEDADAPRKKPLFIRNPYAVEHRWIIHLPEGFGSESLPENRTFAFGSARLSYSFSRRATDAIEACYRFECNQRVWSPAEVMEARKALREFGTGKPPRIVLQQEGEAHLAAGRLKEALAVYRKAAEKAGPAESGPLVRLARMQLAAGLGRQAQATVREAIRRKGEDPQAWAALGWILQHDALGRRFGSGWVRGEALEAYRKASVLDPKDRNIKWNQAVLLEHDENGTRYASAREDQEAALALYRAALEGGREEALENNLMHCLAELRRYEEAYRTAKARQGSPYWDGWTVALAACTKGIEPALEEASRAIQDPDARRQALLSAGDNLFSLRRYAEASALLSAGAAGSEKEGQVRARAELVAKLSRQEPPSVPSKDPREFPFAYLHRLLEGRSAYPRLRALFAKAQRPFIPDGVLDQRRQQLLDLPLASGQSGGNLMDLIRSRAEFAAEGNAAGGYLVRIQRSGYWQVFGLTVEEGGLRLVSTSFDEAAFARQALKCVERQDQVGALAWLDRAVARCGTANSKDPFLAHPVFQIHAKGQAQGPAILQLAATTVLALAAPDDAAMAALKEAHRLNLAGPLHEAVAVALAHAHIRRGEFEACEAVLRPLAAQHPGSLGLKLLRASLLAGAGRWKELLELAESAPKADPDEALVRARIKALVHLKRGAEAETFFKTVVAKGKVSELAFQEFAWAEAAEGRVTAYTLECARKGVPKDGDRSVDAELTVALALAEVGRLGEAREALLKALELGSSTTPSPQAWYVLGRIDEQLGEPEAALEAYSQAKTPYFTTASDTNLAVALAQARAKSLKPGRL